MGNKNFFVMLVVMTSLLLFSMRAAAQDTITPGETIEGTLDGEPQTYSIDATQGQLLVINMISDEFDNAITLQQGGTDIASDDDSGGDLNALLAYVVQEDGTYDIVAGASFVDDASGPYSLAVDLLDPPMIAAGSSAMLEPAAEGSQELYAVIDGAAGDVVNIWATNTAEDEDVRVALYGIDGEEIEVDDDDGPGYNAMLRRVVLPADGLHLIKASASFSAEGLLQPVEVMVESSEALFLSAEPQELVLGDGPGQIGTEVYTVEMTAGTTYRFIVTIEPVPDEVVGVNLTLLDTDKFFEPEVDVQHGVGASWDYLATADGTARLEVHASFFGSDVESKYTIALEIIE